MKKHFLMFWIACFLFCGISGTALAAGIQVTIDSVPVNFTQSSGYPFLDENSRTLVPLRGAMESYGCSVDWDQNTQTASVRKDGKTVLVPLGVNYIEVDGIQVQNDTKAIMKNGRIYLPIRIVLESFEAQVGWNAATSTVVVISPGTDPGGEDIQIHFIDVGQADSILIDAREYEVLIDAGNNQDGDTVTEYLRPYVDGALDLVIATHGDADHIGGMDDVLAAYQVNQLIDSGERKDTQTFRDYWTAAMREPNCQVREDSDCTISLGGNAYLQIIETGDNYEDSNNNSVVSLLVYDEVKVLFTGDMESDVEKRNLHKFSDVDVLKSGHHGSASSSCMAFLEKTRPEYVVVSAGLRNSYGHPAATTLNNYFSVGAKVLGTFRSGDIIMTTDGKNYSFNSADYLTLADAGAGQGAIEEGPVITPPDSVQYIGNKNTKKFHLLSCRYADQISSGNIIYFQSRAEAVGYTPCKVCNP